MITLKKTIPIFLVFTLLFFNCEEAIIVDLTTEPPRLVIEASINWRKGTNGNLQKIKLTNSTDYYNNNTPVVSGATVFIKNNSSNTSFSFIESPQTGEYVCTNFIPVLNESYTLTVINNGNTYTASETLKPVAPITRVEQNNNGSITGSEIEIRAFYTDPDNEKNYYLYKYSYSNQAKKDYYVNEDTFYQGLDFFSISQNTHFKKGDTVEITHYGISNSYFNYMNIVLSNSRNSENNPFQTPPVITKGNIRNITNPNQPPLGYFSLSEIDTKTFTIQ
ncbi:DUF4249 family protein [Flavobacterium sp. NG2]|uniref:DUF4249 family protein n=1 Tax=Flavobacterium sp. NG2 TaxID=3097547 RepID=UPI002A7EFF1D|nr:DUF4249 family protein [Flavobacterium sp. NG2]WPR71225.1 DUF4249 family protein [Flavobacterium sp. NG2]